MSDAERRELQLIKSYWEGVELSFDSPDRFVTEPELEQFNHVQFLIALVERLDQELAAISLPVPTPQN